MSNETKKYTVEQKYEVWYRVEVESDNDEDAMEAAEYEILHGNGEMLWESKTPVDRFWVSDNYDENISDGRNYENGELL
jgi:hypothetical protein